MADDLFVNLHQLAAAPISVCRRAVLQKAVETLGISMFESTSFNEDTEEILATIGLIVPDNIYMPRIKQWLFHGDWSLSSDAAVQSACFSTLAYLQKVNMVAIDGIHSAELKRCRRDLLQASSWAEVFEDHAKKLQSKLSSLLDAKECTDGQPLVPIDSNSMPGHAGDQAHDEIGQLPSHLATKHEPPRFRMNPRTKRKVLVPAPLQVHDPPKLPSIGRNARSSLICSILGVIVLLDQVSFLKEVHHHRTYQVLLMTPPTGLTV